jgi:hypothetical protein
VRIELPPPCQRKRNPTIDAQPTEQKPTVVCILARPKPVTTASAACAVTGTRLHRAQRSHANPAAVDEVVQQYQELTRVDGRRCKRAEAAVGEGTK